MATPNDVARAIANLAVSENIRYRRQVASADMERKRYARAHANGYHGPMTRADLAAQCLRRQHDNTQ